LQEFELERYCFDAAELSGEVLISGFEEVVRDADGIKEKIKKHLPRIRASSAMNHETAWQLYSSIWNMHGITRQEGKK